MSRTNFDTLLEAGCHFGHLKRKWNPAMAPYIFMERNGIPYDGIDAASASFVRKVGAEFVQQGRFRRRSVPDRFAQADEP